LRFQSNVAPVHVDVAIDAGDPIKILGQRHKIINKNTPVFIQNVKQNQLLLNGINM
jgi:hypothetical protein